MEPLKGSQRKYLREQAHHLKPIVIIGVKGVTKNLLETVDSALKEHELIKVKFAELKESKKKSREKSPKLPRANRSASSATSLFSTANNPIRKKGNLKYQIKRSIRVTS